MNLFSLRLSDKTFLWVDLGGKPTWLIRAVGVYQLPSYGVIAEIAGAMKASRPSHVCTHSFCYSNLLFDMSSEHVDKCPCQAIGLQDMCCDHKTCLVITRHVLSGVFICHYWIFRLDDGSQLFETSKSMIKAEDVRSLPRCLPELDRRCFSSKRRITHSDNPFYYSVTTLGIKSLKI